MIRVHLFLPESDLEHIDLLARNRGIPKSEMIRKLLAQALTKHPISKELPIDNNPANRC